ncbi:MAG: FkbM family methyltransferase [Patescibacteria group bacterium]
MTRILKKDRVLKIREGGGRIYVRNIFGPDFVVAHEMFSRDDYGLASVSFNSANPVILDIGANIGTFSIFAINLFKNAKIFAYEPEESNYRVLVDNIKLNKATDKAFPYQLAVGAESGKRTFFLSTSEYAHSLEQGRVRCISGDQEVLCTTIEDIMQKNNIKFIDLLKLDIEGSEFEVLYQLPEKIYNNIQYIAFEIHEHGKHSADALLTFLKKKHFDIVQPPTHQNVYLLKNIACGL